MDIDSTTTRLLTLLNASAVKPGKRKREEPPLPSEKLNKRKSVQFSEGLTEKENIARIQEVEETADTVFEEIVDLEDGNSEGWSTFYSEQSYVFTIGRPIRDSFWFEAANLHRIITSCRQPQSMENVQGATW
jgi:hypothetical protein